MYGIILRLDAGRQQRVGTKQLKSLLKSETYKKVIASETKLNSSRDYTSPFAPTVVRPEFYPAFLRATDVRTIFWKIKNVSDFHDLSRAYINPDGKFVLEFNDTVDDERCALLCSFLEDCDHLELTLSANSGKKVTFDITNLTDSATEDVQPSNTQESE